MIDKSVMLSLQPKWWHLIRSGQKTGELRKSFPKLKTPFKVYVYCTKKQTLLDIIKDGDDCYGETYHGKPVFVKTNDGFHGESGYVVGEFICKGVIILEYTGDGILNVPEPTEESRCCTYLTVEQARKYLQGENGYIWNISDLNVYSQPKKLEEFGLKRPPQSWQYVGTELAMARRACEKQ